MIRTDIDDRDPLPSSCGDQPRGLTFLDLSSFYSPTGGGIRTYHQAKLAWFSAQSLHRYVLVHPGPRFAVTRLAPAVTTVAIYGAPVGAGYRLPVDLRRVRSLVRRFRPDVMETGDPWVSGPLGLLCRRLGYVSVVSSFYHSDPIRTYVTPWVERTGPLIATRRRLGVWADRLFFRQQRAYDVTVASSAWIADMLQRRGITTVLRAPFGVDPLFLHAGEARPARPGPRTRLLFAGRLQNDKAVDLLCSAIPSLLTLPEASLTVVGGGPSARTVEALRSPRVRLLGYESSRARLAAVYGDHDVLLAPGPNETFGLGVLEALAAGMSVVAPDAGGSGEVLRRLPFPHLFARDDRDDFVRAVVQATEASASGEAQAGRDLARAYGTWSQAIDREVEGYCRYWSLSTT